MELVLQLLPLRSEEAGDIEDQIDRVRRKRIDASVAGGHKGHVRGDRSVDGIQG